MLENQEDKQSQAHHSAPLYFWYRNPALIQDFNLDYEVRVQIRM